MSDKEVDAWVSAIYVAAGVAWIEIGFHWWSLTGVMFGFALWETLKRRRRPTR